MTILISDTFTDTDNVLLADHTPEIGGAWTNQPAMGDTAFITGDAVFNSIATSFGFINAVVPETHEYSIEIVSNNENSADDPGILVRYSDSSPSDGYLCKFLMSTASCEVYRLNTGSFTSVKTWTALGTIIGTPNTLRVNTTIDANGDPTLELFVDDVSFGEFIDTDADAIIDIGFAGFYIEGTGTSVDNFVLEGVAAAGNPPHLTGTFDLADGVEGDSYNVDLTTLNTGDAATSWAWNGTPPPWASLNTSTGLITGTATEGTWAGYTVTATNADGSDTSNTDSVTVSAALLAPSITGTFDLVDGDVGGSYNVDLTTLNTGGTAASWAWNGTPPPWASLNTSTGLITGTSTEGTWSGYSVTATNATGSNTSNTDSVTVSAVTSSSITVTAIDVNSVHQREAGFASVPVEGTYTGTPTAIQGRVTSGGSEIVAWATVDVAPTGGTYSGTLSVPTGGPYKVETRFSNATGTTDTDTEGFHVGDLFLITGQSNASYWFSDSPADDANSNVKIHENGIWTAGLSDRAAIAMGNKWSNEVGVPCGMVEAASSGSALTEDGGGGANYWLSNANARDDVYNSDFLPAVAEIGGKVAGLVWDQAGADAASGVVTELEYQTALTALFGFFREDLNYPNLPISCVYLGGSETAPVGNEDDEWQGIRNAQRTVIEANVNNYSVSTFDVAKRDGLHDVDHVIRASRSFQTFLYLYGFATYHQSAKISNVVRVSSTVFDLNITHTGGTDFTPSTNINAFLAYDDAVEVGVASVERQTATSIRVTLSAAATGTISISYLHGKAPGKDDIVMDNSTLVVPLEWIEPLEEGEVALLAPDMTGTLDIPDSEEGQGLSLNLATLNTGGAATSWAWNGTPPGWASLNTSTGSISGWSEEGIWSGYSVTATNTTGSDTSNTDSVTVSVTALVPDITGTLDIPDSVEGTSFSADLSALNTGGAATSWAWNGTPPGWASLNTSTGLITGTSAVGAWAGYSVTATNTTGSDTSNTDSVTVSAVSQAPNLSGTLDIPDSVEGTSLSLNLATLNTGGAATSWAWNGTPPGWASLNTSTGLITGTSVIGGWAGYSVTATNTTGSDTSNTDSVTVSAASGSKKVSINLVSTAGTPLASLSGLRWAFFDEARPDILTTVVNKGANESTDSNGNLEVLIPSTSLAAGGVGWLVVSDTDGLVSTNHQAFCGPVTVEAG